MVSNSGRLERAAAGDKQLLMLVEQIIVTHERQGAPLTLSVFTLSTELVQLVHAAPPVEARAAVSSALPLTYDGGTDISLLDQLAGWSRDSDAVEQLDYIMLCTDGIDSKKLR